VLVTKSLVTASIAELSALDVTLPTRAVRFRVPLRHALLINDIEHDEMCVRVGVCVCEEIGVVV
jgi:hypothetical protein